MRNAHDGLKVHMTCFPVHAIKRDVELSSSSFSCKPNISSSSNQF